MPDYNPGPAESQSSNQVLDLVPSNLNAALATSVNDSTQVGFNTALIQNALNAAVAANQNQLSIVAAGTIYVNTIYIPEGMTAYIGPQTTIKGGPFNMNNVFTTASMLNPEVQISSISYNATGNVASVVTSSAHGLIVGSWVAIYFVYPDGYPGVFQVQSVADSTHFTYNPIVVPLVTSASTPSNLNYNTGSGSNPVVMTMRKAQGYAGLINDGTIDYGTNFTANGVLGNLSEIGMFHTAKVLIGGRGWYTHAIDVLHCSNIVDLLIDNVNVDAKGLSADGIHIVGPIYNGVIRNAQVKNATQEAFGIGGVDYAIGMVSAGAIHALSISDATIVNCGAGLEFFGGRPTTSDTFNWKVNCTIERPVGSVTAGPVIRITNDAGDPNTTTANIGIIETRNMNRIRTATANPNIYGLSATTMDRLVIHENAEYSIQNFEGYIQFSGNVDAVDIYGLHMTNTNNGVLFGFHNGITRPISLNLFGVYCDSTVYECISADATTYSGLLTCNVYGGNFAGLTYFISQNSTANWIINFMGATVNSGTYLFNQENSGTLTINAIASNLDNGGFNLYVLNSSGGNVTIQGTGNTLGKVDVHVVTGATSTFTWKTSSSQVTQFFISNVAVAGAFISESYDAAIDVTAAAVSTSVFPQWALSTTAGAGKAGQAVKVNGGAANTWYALATGAGGVNTLIV